MLRLRAGPADDVGWEGAVEVPVVQTWVIQELSPRSAGTVLTAPHSRRVDLSQVLQRSRHCPVYDRPQHRHRAVANDGVPSDVQLKRSPLVIKVPFVL